MPDINIKENQTKVIKIVCPKSGWNMSKIIIGAIKRKLRKNLKYKFFMFCRLNITPIETIKKGFNNSIGWNLGTKGKSIHLLDPFISEPINGTSIKKNRQIIKNIKEILNSFFFSIKDNETKTNILKIMNTKCLIKK